MLKIEKYEFEEHPEYEVALYAVRDDLVMGSYLHGNVYIPITVDWCADKVQSEIETIGDIRYMEWKERDIYIYIIRNNYEKNRMV